MSDKSTSVTLDYRFGWRWLLPDRGASGVKFFGLSDEEVQWWRTAIEEGEPVGSENSAEGCLFNAEQFSVADALEVVSTSSPRWVAVWGHGTAIASLRKALRGFSDVREYALLPAGNPRVVVPLSSSANAISGLRLHRPGRIIGRLGVAMAALAALLGNHSLLRGKVLMIAAREAVVRPGGASKLERSKVIPHDQDYALYLGTPDTNRKTVILPIVQGKSPAIVKMAESARSRQALRSEAAALKALGDSPLRSHIPEFIQLKDSGKALSLVQHYRQRQWVSQRRFQREVAVFLAGLSKLSVTRVRVHDYLAMAPVRNLAALSAEQRSSVVALENQVRLFSESSGWLYLHRCHGDFAPWNCAWTRNGLFVFDWEESQTQGLALSDAFYFTVAPFVHICRDPVAEKALDQALCFARKVKEHDGYLAIEVELYFALWLLDHLTESAFYLLLAQSLCARLSIQKAGV